MIEQYWFYTRATNREQYRFFTRAQNHVLGFKENLHV